MLLVAHWIEAMKELEHLGQRINALGSKTLCRRHQRSWQPLTGVGTCRRETVSPPHLAQRAKATSPKPPCEHSPVPTGTPPNAFEDSRNVRGLSSEATRRQPSRIQR
jgi:hypothetical protein